MTERDPKSRFAEVQRRNPFELSLDSDTRAMLEELALRYKVSLDPHDPTMMTYVMVRHITARTRDQLKALIDAADEERFQQFEHQRRTLNEDTKRIVEELKANLVKTFDSDRLANEVKDRITEKVKNELEDMLSRHMFDSERRVNKVVAEHREQAHRTNLMWAVAVGILLITLVACCGDYVRSLIRADKPSTRRSAQVAAPRPVAQPPPCVPERDARRAARQGPPPRLKKQRAVPAAVPARPLGAWPDSEDRLQEVIDLLPDLEARDREVLELVRPPKY